jgi:hypothetical protein
MVYSDTKTQDSKIVLQRTRGASFSEWYYGGIPELQSEGNKQVREQIVASEASCKYA